MILDENVNMIGLHPAMALLAMCVESAFLENGYEARVSSGGAVRRSQRPGRERKSLHPLGCALDFGLAHVRKDDWGRIAVGVQRRVKTAIVDVVYEANAEDGPHIHVELDP